MKTNLKIFLCFLVFVFAASSSLFAQNLSTVPTTTPAPAPAAELTDDLKVTLNTDLPVSETYVVDVSHYAANMPDQQTADAFIDQFERDYANLEVNLASMKATITLELNVITTPWTVAQWNQHLSSN